MPFVRSHGASTVVCCTRPIKSVRFVLRSVDRYDLRTYLCLLTNVMCKCISTVQTVSNTTCHLTTHASRSSEKRHPGTNFFGLLLAISSFSRRVPPFSGVGGSSEVHHHGNSQCWAILGGLHEGALQGRRTPHRRGQGTGAHEQRGSPHGSAVRSVLLSGRAAGTKFGRIRSRVRA